MTIQMKATEQYFSVVLFIILYKAWGRFNCGIFGRNPEELPFKWKLLRLLSCCAVYYALQSSSKCWICWWNPKVWPFKWKLLSNTFLWYWSIRCTRWFWLVLLFFFFLKGTDSNQRHAKDNLLDFSQLLFGSWTDRFGQESVHGCLWEVW